MGRYPPYTAMASAAEDQAHGTEPRRELGKAASLMPVRAVGPIRSWSDAAFERTQPRRDVAVWNRRRAEQAQGISSEWRSMGSGLCHARHKPHENPGTELAELPTVETLRRRAASVCHGWSLENLWGLERGYKTQFGKKLRFFSMDRRTLPPPASSVSSPETWVTDCT